MVRRRQLEAVLHECIRHDDAHRPHRSLGFETPEAMPTPLSATRVSRGQIRRRDRLGGLLHEYERAA